MKFKFTEYQKLFLGEFKRLYRPKDDIDIIFLDMVVSYTYPILLSMYSGFLMGFITMDSKKISKETISFMNKFTKLRQEKLGY